MLTIKHTIQTVRGTSNTPKAVVANTGLIPLETIVEPGWYPTPVGRKVIDDINVEDDASYVHVQVILENNWVRNVGSDVYLVEGTVIDHGDTNVADDATISDATGISLAVAANSDVVPVSDGGGFVESVGGINITKDIPTDNLSVLSDVSWTSDGITSATSPIGSVDAGSISYIVDYFEPGILANNNYVSVTSTWTGG